MSQQQVNPVPPVNPAADRILHMSDKTREELEKVRAWADKEGLREKLEEGLEYLRTYSGGPESDWRTELCLDLPWRLDDPCFIGNICRRVPWMPELAAYEGTALRRFMTIGMIWRRHEREWSFHS